MDDMALDVGQQQNCWWLVVVCSIPGLRSTELDETWLNGLSQLSDEERILTAI